MVKKTGMIHVKHCQRDLLTGLGLRPVALVGEPGSLRLVMTTPESQGLDQDAPEDR